MPSPATRSVSFSLWILCMAVTACGPGRPAESDGEAALTTVIDDGQSPRLRIERFEKTDGRPSEAEGVPMYTMMFAARLEFFDDAMYSVGMPMVSQASRIATGPYVPEPTGFSWNEFLGSSQGQRRARRGDRLALEGEMAFERRESGWTPVGIVFTFAHDSTTRVEQAAAEPPTSASPQAESGAAAGTSPESPSVAGREDPTCVAADQVTAQSDYPVWAGQSPNIEPGERLGRIRHLRNRGVCVGRYLVLERAAYDDGGELRVSNPGTGAADGLLWLHLNDLKAGPLFAAIVHPDSARPLSTDAIAPYRSPTTGWPVDAPRGFGYGTPLWSPDGRSAVFVGDSVTVFPVGLGQARTFPRPALEGQELCFYPTLDLWDDNTGEPLYRWVNSSVLRVGTHLVRMYDAPPECQMPRDSVATLDIDIKRGTVARR